MVMWLQSLAAGGRRLLGVGLLFLGCVAGGAADAQEGRPASGQPAWVEARDDGGKRVHLYFFWSESCPHCQAAHPFVGAIAQQRLW